ncbi:hypothetical protein D0T53_03890 [Dysgonomonas sp. 216]|uniref:LiaF transmembrane domain-containing protein n=1 Tax=Dysgonomonas sp. 216 TaxID=2302934 RepID=UPI0013D468B4|nr:hypothetical protein [Dysgonomonas sp. 216]NDW18058.1 hypothetical protein [Dysgonomonas sp. 216]
MARGTGDRLAYGLTILTFGTVILLDKTGVLARIPYGYTLMSIGSFFLIAGIIFLCTKAEKSIGVIFTLIGVLINSNFFFGWMRNYSNLLIPVILIVAGLIMVLTSRK